MKKILPIIFIVISVVLSVAALYTFPDTYASHWDMYGLANGFSKRGISLFLFPVIQLLVWGLMYYIPKIDPKSKNIKQFDKEYEKFIITFLGFFTFLHTITYLWNTGVQINISYVMIPGLSIFFYMIGGLLDKAKMNYSIGIRTPWTLANEEVWDKTHKMGAKLIKIGALVSLLGVLDLRYGFYFFLAAILTPFFYLYWYSYSEYKKLKNA